SHRYLCSNGGTGCRVHGTRQPRRVGRGRRGGPHLTAVAVCPPPSYGLRRAHLGDPFPPPPLAAPELLAQRFAAQPGAGGNADAVCLPRPLAHVLGVRARHRRPPSRRTAGPICITVVARVSV